MTPDQLEQQSRDAVIAYLQDSSVKLEIKIPDIGWIKLDRHGLFDLNNHYYRIAQPKPWYRVALYDYGPDTVIDEQTEQMTTELTGFIKWLTDRIEYSDD